jgi:DNA-binding Lrp family transcriptional regulator
MKNREKEVLIELLKNCKISDRQLAQKLNTSQSTITRIRKRLEKKIIKLYTALPDFSKLNINLASVTFGKCNRSEKDIAECLETLSDKYPRIIYMGEGEGMGKTCMIISLHRDFVDYTKFSREFRSGCKGIKDAVDSFLISTKDSFQTFNLSKTVKDILKEEKSYLFKNK